jgi:hypothetical protein
VKNCQPAKKEKSEMKKNGSIGIITILVLVTASCVAVYANDTKDTKLHKQSSATLIGTTTFTVTVSVWSDGYVDVGPMIELDSRRANRLAIRLKDTEKQDKKRNAGMDELESDDERKQRTNWPLGDRCHAETKAGKRCSRGSKATSGLCWQHVDSDYTY